MSSGVPSSPAPASKISEATLPTPVSSPPSASLSWPWQGMQTSFHDFLKSEVDPELSAIPLTAYCFMTGWMCAVFTHLLSFSRDSLIPYRTAMQYASPPYSFGVRSKLATHCRCIIVLSSRVPSSARSASINHNFSLLWGLSSSPLRLPASSRVLLGTATPPSTSRTSRPSPL
jgi:hypothetical protein